jgi:putative aminopeptidase FrvX
MGGFMIAEVARATKNYRSLDITNSVQEEVGLRGADDY